MTQILFASLLAITIAFWAGWWRARREIGTARVAIAAKIGVRVDAGGDMVVAIHIDGVLDGAAFSFSTGSTDRVPYAMWGSIVEKRLEERRAQTQPPG